MVSVSGEYVITVQDLTSPSFMDVTLETAFMVVKVLPLVKKRKEKHRPVKKDKGPKYVSDYFAHHVLSSKLWIFRSCKNVRVCVCDNYVCVFVCLCLSCMCL